MIAASRGVGFEVPLKLGHMSDGDTDRLLKHEGLPAFGWISNLRRQGNKLLTDVVNIPAFHEKFIGIIATAEAVGRGC